MTREVRFPATAPDWPAVADLMSQHGWMTQMRMIDGNLVAPDEEPPEAWQELRVARNGEMVTIRREPGKVSMVAWDNANLAQRQLWNALAWAFAEAGEGTVLTDAGLLSAAAFAKSTEMPPEWKA